MPLNVNWAQVYCAIQGVRHAQSHLECHAGRVIRSAMRAECALCRVCSVSAVRQAVELEMNRTQHLELERAAARDEERTVRALR